MPKTAPTLDISDEAPVEHWLPIAGFEDCYEVSDLGRVRSLARVVERGHGRPLPLKQRVLSPEVRHGYHVVHLRKDGRGAKCYIHRLVLLAFVGEPEPGFEACHNNDIRSDNRLENLRWDTHQANVDDCHQRGRYRNPNIGRPHCRRGHLFDEANTIITRDKGRSCRECRRLKERERYHRNQALGITKQYNPSLQTHCKRGHEFTTENTYVRSNGKRNCIQCRNLKMEEWRQGNGAA